LRYENQLVMTSAISKFNYVRPPLVVNEQKW